MSTENHDTGEALVAFVSGFLIGVATTVLFVRRQGNRRIGANANYDDYHYDGGDIFI